MSKPQFAWTPQAYALDQNLAGATLTAYLAGTTTPATLYADKDLSTSLGSSITADANGRFVNYFVGSTADYKIVLQHTASGTNLTFDNVVLGGALGAPVLVHRVNATAGQTVFTLPVAYTLNAQAVTVFVNGLRLEQGVGQDWVETNSTTITFNSGLALNDLVTFVVASLAQPVPITAFPAASVSAFGASLVDDADAAAARTTLGLGSLAVINSPLPIANGGTGATTAGAALTALGGQPIDATLTALAGLATGADKLAYSTGTDTFSQADLTSFARTLLDDANAGAARTTLGVGTGDSPTFAGLTIADTGNIVLATGTGTKIGTATGQKLGFYNATPVAQHSSTGETAGATGSSGTTVHVTATFTGNVGSTAYTISDIVKALKNLGLLAS